MTSDNILILILYIQMSKKSSTNNKKKDWKSIFLEFLSRTAPFSSKIGPVDADTAPLALLHLLLALDHKRPVFFASANLARAEQCREDFTAWASFVNQNFTSMILPDGSTLTQKVLSSDSPRAKALFRMTHDCPDVVFGSVSGLSAPAPRPSLMRDSELPLHTGDTIKQSDLVSRLVSMDYDDEPEVSAAGEFSRHGGLVDVFSSSEELPARIEFFGNEIDSIRLFDPVTQLSVRKVSSYRIILRSGSSFAAAEQDERHVIEKVSGLDYLDDGHYLLIQETPGDLLYQLEHYGTEEDADKWLQWLDKNQENSISLEDTAGSAAGECEPFPCFSTGKDALAANLPPEQREELETEHAFSFLAQQVVASRIRQWISEKTTVRLLIPPEINQEQIDEFLKEHQLEQSDLLRIDHARIPCGFYLPEQKTAVLTLREIYALPHKHRSLVQDKMTELLRERSSSQESNSFHEQDISAEAFNLSEGDYAVHLNYGICIYHGLRITESNGLREEMIELEFDDDVTMRLSIKQAHLLTRYIGAKSTGVILSKINGTRWKNKRQEAFEAIRTLAFDMLRIQALREKSPGTSFPEDTPEQTLFEQAFPFYETADQLRANAEIKRDMESDKPMDRLLCGDVGFGKTELAMRAACKCALSGRQTAILVPTTVLAQQHYLSFRERFAGTSIVIEQLSRFKTKKEQAEIVQRLKQGAVDIVIGTHRILSNDVQFKNPGLLIIDEEQRFGVIHKERLKHLRATIDVLAMTATPIPRTLHLSLSGIRDLSTLMNAPVHRLPIKTIFAQYDMNVIRSAIELELSRGGQVYYLHNRVKTIEQEAAMIRAMFPDIEVAVGHGQMDKSELEEIMTKFIEGSVKILVCTTIIESGIDIPNANTIIIDRADRFGLAELYQLRGRVGRWVRQAYAYLFLPKDNILTGNARKRIAAVRKYTHLGSGFQLAMSDLEIRGAGNILGAEQSGQINAIGFHLYCTLLRDCVAHLKGEVTETHKPCTIHLDFLVYAISTKDDRICACIPPDYIENESTRLHEYRRLALFNGKESQIDEYSAEMKDRFGKIPESFEHLLLVNRIRLCAEGQGIDSVSCQDNTVYLEKNGVIQRMKNKCFPVLPSCLKNPQKLKMILNILHEIQSGK